MPEVKRVQTKRPREAFLSAFTNAWYFTQGAPGILAGGILFAQYAFETGHGEYCYCDNIGNVRAYEDWKKAHDYFNLPGAWEILNGKRVVTGGFFRAHESLAAGMESHLRFLAGLERYKHAFAVIQEASLTQATRSDALSLCERYVRALKMGGYFTGDVDKYVAGAQSIVGDLLRTYKPPPVDPLAGSAPWEPLMDWTPPELMTSLDIIFGETWDREFLSCRYDCEG
jgi:hypothetical protein